MEKVSGPDNQKSEDKKKFLIIILINNPFILPVK